tara:strand:+ start:10155 stop:10604 length:450 start_codon:yes stop_codon:yes gene_type:complete
MRVRIQKLTDDAVLPAYSQEGDAGMDMIATKITIGERYVQYHTGLAMEIPKGHVGLLFARSSVSKTGWSLANGVGVVDTGYRGEICFRFVLNGDEDEPQPLGLSPVSPYKVGDRIGQIMILPYPRVDFEQVLVLSDSIRGEGGFGSTGN